LIDDKKIQEQT